MKKRAHFIIKGRVQGVCFRMYTQQEASRLNITGWVRNCPDGTVEVMAEGDEDAIDQLYCWCQQGPSYASVKNIHESYSDPTGEFETFRITY